MIKCGLGISHENACVACMLSQRGCGPFEVACPLSADEAFVFKLLTSTEIARLSLNITQTGTSRLW